MRKLLSVVFIFCLPYLLLAQLKENTKLPSFSQVGIRPNSNLILGFLNSDRLKMHHSFSMSYMSLGKAGGMMVNSYLNTIDYQISHPLFLRLNLGIANSPYNSFSNPALNNTQFFGGAELSYRLNENSFIKVGVDVRPGYYGPAYYQPGYYLNGYDW
jgi:hypothetical protein